MRLANPSGHFPRMPSPSLSSNRLLPIAGAFCAFLVTTLAFSALAQAETCGNYLHTASEPAPSTQVETEHHEGTPEFPVPVCNGPRCQKAPLHPASQPPTIPQPITQRIEATKQGSYIAFRIEFEFERAAEMNAAPIDALRIRLDRPPR